MKRVTIMQKHDTIWQDQKHALDIMENVTRFVETLIQLFVIQRKTCHDLLKTWHDFGKITVPI